VIIPDRAIGPRRHQLGQRYTDGTKRTNLEEISP
jgi:hypothetical protein